MDPILPAFGSNDGRSSETSFTSEIEDSDIINWDVETTSSVTFSEGHTEIPPLPPRVEVLGVLKEFMVELRSLGIHLEVGLKSGDAVGEMCQKHSSGIAVNHIVEVIEKCLGSRAMLAFSRTESTAGIVLDEHRDSRMLLDVHISGRISQLPEFTKGHQDASKIAALLREHNGDCESRFSGFMTMFMLVQLDTIFVLDKALHKNTLSVPKEMSRTCTLVIDQAKSVLFDALETINDGPDDIVGVLHEIRLVQSDISVLLGLLLPPPELPEGPPQQVFDAVWRSLH